MLEAGPGGVRSSCLFVLTFRHDCASLKAIAAEARPTHVALAFNGAVMLHPRECYLPTAHVAPAGRMRNNVRSKGPVQRIGADDLGTALHGKAGQELMGFAPQVVVQNVGLGLGMKEDS